MLKDADIVNLNMARHAQAPCLLVGDIDRGGVFAALAGTMLLLERDERVQIKAFLINKFRGDPALLGSALDDLCAKAYGVPTLGVVPFVPDLHIASEDAVDLDADRASAASSHFDIVVVHLPHIANFDDFDPLEREANLALRYVRYAQHMGSPQAIILPGTKATLADLQWLRDRGLDQAMLKAQAGGAAVVGICGGFQILGRNLVDPLGVEGGGGAAAPGLNLLPVETRFAAQKQTHQTRVRLADGTCMSGYEIHMGETILDRGTRAFSTIVERQGCKVDLPDGAISADGQIWGTYLHGLFANTDFRRQWLTDLGWKEPETVQTKAEDADCDRLADVVAEAIDWSHLMRIMDIR